MNRPFTRMNRWFDRPDASRGRANSRHKLRVALSPFAPPLARRVQKYPASFYITGAALLLSRVLPLPQGGLIGHLPSLCPFFNLTGLPCPGCGLTRSWVCFAHGHGFEALRWHPLGPLLFGAAGLYLVGVVRGWRLPRERWFVPTLAALLLACWALRLSGVWPLPTG